MSHHKIWESGKNPSKRNDKGRKKPVQARNARKRLQAFKKKYGGGANLPPLLVCASYETDTQHCHSEPIGLN